MEKNLYIFGCSGIAKSIVDSIYRIESLSPRKVYFVDSNKELSGTNFYCGYPVVHTDDLSPNETKGHYAIAAYYKPRDIFSRNIEFEKILQRYCLKRLSVVDPAATISPSAEISLGVYIAPNVVVDADAKICEDSIVLFNSVVSREVIIGRNVFVSASVVIKGGVEIGDGTFVSAGCLITKNIEGRVFVNAGVILNDTVSTNTIVGNKSSVMTINLPDDVASAERRLRFFHP